MPGQVKLSDNLPILQETRLGWVVAGTVDPSRTNRSCTVGVQSLSANNKVQAKPVYVPRPIETSTVLTTVEVSGLSEPFRYPSPSYSRKKSPVYPLISQNLNDMQQIQQLSFPVSCDLPIHNNQSRQSLTDSHLSSTDLRQSKSSLHFVDQGISNPLIVKTVLNHLSDDPVIDRFENPMIQSHIQVITNPKLSRTSDPPKPPFAPAGVCSHKKRTVLFVSTLVCTVLAIFLLSS